MTKKHIKKLKIIGSISSCDWKMYKKITDSFESGEIKCTHFKSYDPWYNDINNRCGNFFSTYEDCRYYSIYYNGDDLYADIFVSNGDTVYGQPKGKRFNATFQLDKSFLTKDILKKIDYRWEGYLSYEYDKFLAEEEAVRKKAWVNNLEKKLLA